MAGPANRTDANLEGRGDIPPALAGSPAFDYLGTVKYHRRAADGGAALGSFDPSMLQARSDALLDEFSFELSNCGQDVHQERGGGARLARVQSLRNSDEGRERVSYCQRHRHTPQHQHNMC
jgi:hypothetical protein